MRYKVALHQSEEGFSVWVPGLPGCCSQGATQRKHWPTLRMLSANIWTSCGSNSIAVHLN
jgi:hypothetical protein